MDPRAPGFYTPRLRSQARRRDHRELEPQRPSSHPSTHRPRVSASPNRFDEPSRASPSHVPSELSPFLNPRHSHLHRHRLRRQREEDHRGSVQDTLDQLDAENLTLASAIEAPLPVLNGLRVYSPPRSDADSHQSRHKRRKLDGDPLDIMSPMRYGFHGQVAPGRLKMHLKSCDGGRMGEAEDRYIRSDYSPENVLGNDKSVYCSKREKANMVFCHSGESCFSMTKIMIKTPDSGFTAPVQEGMVFATLSAQDLTSRTAYYQIHETSRPLLSTSESRDGSNLWGSISSNQNTRFSAANRGHTEDDRPPSRRNDHNDFRLARLQETLGVLDRRELRRNLGYHLDEDEDADHRSPVMVNLSSTAASQGPAAVHAASLPAEATSMLSSPASGFSVGVSCEGPSDDEEDPSSPEILLDRQGRRERQERQRRRDSLATSSEDEDEDDGLGDGRNRQRATPRLIEWVEKAAAADVKALSTGKAVEPLKPLTRFFIHKKKHVVTLKFDPPVSAKYVLLKFWSPSPTGCEGNIDIQNVSIFGFAGPRYFPAVKPL